MSLEVCLRPNGDIIQFSVHGEKISKVDGVFNKTRRTGSIENVFLASKGQGLGRAVIERIESAARRHGVQTLHITTYPTPLKFWEKMGYKPFFQSGTYIKAKKQL